LTTPVGMRRHRSYSYRARTSVLPVIRISHYINQVLKDINEKYAAPILQQCLLLDQMSTNRIRNC